MSWPTGTSWSSASTCEFVRLCAGQRGYDPLQSAQSPQEFQRYGRDRAVAEGQSLGLVLPVGTVSGVTLWRLRKDAAASVGLFDSRGATGPTVKSAAPVRPR